MHGGHVPMLAMPTKAAPKCPCSTEAEFPIWMATHTCTQLCGMSFSALDQWTSYHASLLNIPVLIGFLFILRVAYCGVHSERDQVDVTRSINGRQTTLHVAGTQQHIYACTMLTKITCKRRNILIHLRYNIVKHT